MENAEVDDNPIPAGQFRGDKITIKVPKKGFTTTSVEKHLSRYANRLLTVRSELIDVSETIRASNQGQKELWLQARDEGLLNNSQLREWVDVQDDRERDTHFISGQQVGLEELFTLLDGAQVEPGEQQRCRCGQKLVN